MPILCASPNSISLPSFICGRTPVSEICEFNQKKKKMTKRSENGYFEFDTFPIVKTDPFLTKCSFDGIITIISIEVHLTTN